MIRQRSACGSIGVCSELQASSSLDSFVQKSEAPPLPGRQLPLTRTRAIFLLMLVLTATVAFADDAVNASSMDFSDLSSAPSDLDLFKLALNIDTNDGNNVDYGNYDFWQSVTELGGATNDATAALTQDYKILDVFASLVVDNILVVVHEESTVIGWRTWKLLYSDQALQEYFGGDSQVNTCWDLATTTIGAGCNQLTNESTSGF